MANAELAERARMFEERAEKATDPMSRQHYREMAAHYRSLSVEHQDGPLECAWVGQAAHSSKGKSALDLAPSLTIRRLVELGLKASRNSPSARFVSLSPTNKRSLRCGASL